MEWVKEIVYEAVQKQDKMKGVQRERLNKGCTRSIIVYPGSVIE